MIMAKAYLGPCQIYMMELFAKIVNGKKPLTVCSFHVRYYSPLEGIEHVDFNDCMSFLPSNFMAEIIPNPEALVANT